jgi:hypothetical protein
MKTAISLPDSVFEQAEALAQQLGMSRSELYTKALQAYLKRHNRDQILLKLNQVYATESSELDPALVGWVELVKPNIHAKRNTRSAIALVGWVEPVKPNIHKPPRLSPIVGYRCRSTQPTLFALIGWVELVFVLRTGFANAQRLQGRKPNIYQPPRPSDSYFFASFENLYAPLQSCPPIIPLHQIVN